MGKNLYPPLPVNSLTKCIYCDFAGVASEFPRRARTGNIPPVCYKCRPFHGKEIKHNQALAGKFGFKRQSAARMLDQPTAGETAMGKILREAKIGHKPQVVLRGFIADYMLKGKGVIVEVDGGYHTTKRQQMYDLGRDSIFYDAGWRTVRVTNEEAINSPDVCLERIREALAKPRLVPVKRKKMSPRQKVIARGFLSL